MNIVRNILHAMGKFFGIGNDLVLFITLSQTPAIINDNVFVTAVLESAFNDKIGGFHNNFFVYILGKCVP